MRWTLREASEKLGISVKALRYRIKKHDLEPTMEDGQHGRRYVLTGEQLEILGTVPSASDEDGIRNLSRQSSRNGPAKASRSPQNRPEESPGDHHDWIPAGVFRETQEVLREALVVSREQREDRLEAERRAEEAEEDALRMGRQVQALMHELSSQRNLLTESAESLSEKRAKVQELELIREQQEEQKLAEIYRVTAEEKSKHEKERAELDEKMKAFEREAEEARALAQENAEKLKEARTELAAWEEQRRLPFWKKLFRSS